MATGAWRVGLQRSPIGRHGRSLASRLHRDEAIQAGLTAKSEEFEEAGGEIYS